MQIEYSIARMSDLEEVIALVRCAIGRMNALGIHQWDEEIYSKTFPMVKCASGASTAASR